MPETKETPAFPTRRLLFIIKSFERTTYEKNEHTYYAIILALAMILTFGAALYANATRAQEDFGDTGAVYNKMRPPHRTAPLTARLRRKKKAGPSA